jgi:hypothetical protein
MNIEKCKAFADVEVVVDGFCLFLMLDMLHLDLAMPPMVSPKRLHCDLSEFDICMIVNNFCWF